MKKYEVKRLVHIDNVVLTPKALERLAAYQQSGEDGVDLDRNMLADAVCFIGKCLYMIDKQYHEEAHEIISNLALIRDNINELKKP